MCVWVNEFGWSYSTTQFLLFIVDNFALKKPFLIYVGVLTLLFPNIFLSTEGRAVNEHLGVLPWYFLQEDKVLQVDNKNHHMGRLAWTTVWRSTYSNFFSVGLQMKEDRSKILYQTHICITTTVIRKSPLRFVLSTPSVNDIQVVEGECVRLLNTVNSCKDRFRNELQHSF